MRLLAQYKSGFAESMLKRNVLCSAESSTAFFEREFKYLKHWKSGKNNQTKRGERLGRNEETEKPKRCVSMKDVKEARQKVKFSTHFRIHSWFTACLVIIFEKCFIICF